MKLPKINLKHIDNRVKAGLITVMAVVVFILILSLILTYPAESVVLVFFSIFIGICGYCIYGVYRGILDSLNGQR